MRVGLEGTALLAHRLTGVQRYILELSNALAALEPSELDFRLLLRMADFRKRRLLPKLPWPTRWYGVRGLPGTLGCDLVHGLAVRLPPTLRRVPYVSTIHDLFAVTVPRMLSPRSIRNRLYHYGRAAGLSERIIAVSEATKADFLRFFAFPEERVSVVPHGVSEPFLRARPDAALPLRRGPPYFVLFGGGARKNPAGAIRAFAASSVCDSIALRIVGPLHPAAADALHECGLERSVRLEPQPNDERMAQLYLDSAGLLYPSLREGFGLPILEAMACGAPVLTSGTGATAEIAGGHAVLVEPESIDSIAAGIEQLAATPPEARVKARRYAREFTWRRTAECTLAVYRSLR